MITEVFNPLEKCEIPFSLKSKKISVLMPFLNEENNIVQNVKKVSEFLIELNLNYEIILVDDGSTDNSYKLLVDNFKNDNKIKVIKNLRNFGKGWALKTGYEFSTGELILFIDSDLELSPEHLPNFLRIMDEENAAAVIGSKLHKNSVINYPFYRRILSIGYYTLVKFLFGLPVMDTQTGIKLFKREALEIALPKVIVKRFAFDIELLLILFKNNLKISSAPIKLDFSRKFGWNFNPEVVFKTFVDTFAVFYRDKILRFYDRPFGENRNFFYSIVLFSEKNDEFEKKAFNTFLNLRYPDYEIILVGNEKFEIDRNYKFLKVDNEKTLIDKLFYLSNSNLIEGEIIVFSKLDSFVDERFLYNAGRILSLDEVGGVSGYLIPFESKGFQSFSHRVMGSFFLNFNLSYRYKPLNFKEIKEINFNGFFIKSYLFKPFQLSPSKRIENLLSELIYAGGKKIYYSPDLMLYFKFPENFKELFCSVKENAYSRAYELKDILKRKKFKLLSFGYVIPLVFLIWLFYSIIFLNKFTITCLLLFYGIVFLSRLVNGFLSLFDGVVISILQVFYSLCFLVGIFRNKKKG